MKIINILKCFVGIHDLKVTTRSTSIDGTVKVYYKCKNCNKKFKDQFNPTSSNVSGENEYDDRRGSNCC